MSLDRLNLTSAASRGPTQDVMPLKVTWQLVAAVDRQSNQMKLFVIGHRRPDLQRFVRGKVIEAGMQSNLPACWAN